MKAVASAPAKAILFGEHAVVYGEPAIVTALDLRTRATVRESDEIAIEARSRGEPVEDLEPIKAMLLEAESRFGIKFSVSIESEVPIGAGLGSSASSAVAVAAAISRIVKRRLDRKLVISLADVAERVAHGNPSGIDSRIVAYGGTMLYARDGTMEFARGLFGGLVVAHTGIPRSTRELVENVRLLTQRIEAARRVVRLIGELVRSVRPKILGGIELNELREYARINHGLLRALGVSHPALDELVRIAKRHGIGSKLTGAGGGGSAIAFSREALEIRDEALGRLAEEYGTKAGTFFASVGAEGARIEGRFSIIIIARVRDLYALGSI